MIGPRLLVQPFEASEAMTAAGIVLPIEAKHEERRGAVVAVGTIWKDTDSMGSLNHAQLPIDVGAVVIYRTCSGTRVSLDLGETGTVEQYLVLELNEVLLVLEDGFEVVS